MRRNSAGMFVLIALLCSRDPVAAQTAPKPKPAPKAPAAKPAPKAPTPAPTPAPLPPATDVQLRTLYTTGAQVSENRTFLQGSRQRFEFPGLTMITQCDRQRSFQLHEGSKRYLMVKTAAASVEAPPPADADATTTAPAAARSLRNPLAKPKGGVITQTTTLTDTGERKPLFGLEARHIKTTVARRPDATACESKAIVSDTDGWYVDLPEHASCTSLPAPAPAPAAAPAACTDRVVVQTSGDARLGFAVSTVMTTTVADAKNPEKDKEVTTISMEVADLAVTRLDAALFEVPAGYTEVKDYDALLPSLAAGGTVGDAIFGSILSGTSTVAPKRAGVIRVGVASPVNKSGQDMPDIRLVGSLLAGFTRAPFDAVPLSGANAADLHRDCASKACDYVLTSDIAEIKTTKPNRVGGALKKVSGDSAGPAEVHQVRIDYHLFAVGEPAKARTSSSVNASSGGGFGVGSAIKLASYAGQLYLSMGMGPGMLAGMMGPGMGGASVAGGFTAGRMNPGMGVAMSILSASTAPSAASAAAEGSPADTVLDGLAKAGKQAADDLRKAKK